MSDIIQQLNHIKCCLVRVLVFWSRTGRKLKRIFEHHEDGLFTNAATLQPVDFRQHLFADELDVLQGLFLRHTGIEQPNRDVGKP